MNESPLWIISALLRALRPVPLVAGALLYTLGSGIARYLGEAIRPDVFWIGLGIITLLQVSADFLREYFDLAGQQAPFEQRSPAVRRPQTSVDGARTPKDAKDRPEEPEPELPPPPPRPAPRVTYLQVGATSLTASVVLMVLLYAQGRLPPAAFLFLGIAFALVVAYAVPPARLVNSGYGELVIAILNANLFSAIGYLLHAGELHRLLAMLTFPLTFLFLAQSLARSLQSYMEDIRRDRQTMMVRAGWQRGMILHNGLVVGAYLLLAFSSLANLDWNLLMPSMLSMPLGIFQVWQVNAIANGAKPRWRVLAITSLATLGLTIYFINLALWTG